jgi:hypothetical protein
MWENCFQHRYRKMNEKWEAEASMQNRKPVGPLISFEESSKGENDSDDWPVALE